MTREGQLYQGWVIGGAKATLPEAKLTALVVVAKQGAILIPFDYSYVSRRVTLKHYEVLRSRKPDQAGPSPSEPTQAGLPYQFLPNPTLEICQNSMTDASRVRWLENIL